MLWQYRTPGHGCTGCGARNRSEPTGALAYGIARHRWTPPRVNPSMVPDAIVARTVCSCILPTVANRGRARLPLETVSDG